jgi:hypothetical protein
MAFFVDKLEEEFKQLGVPNISEYPTLPNLTRKILKEFNVHDYMDVTLKGSSRRPKALSVRVEDISIGSNL